MKKIILMVLLVLFCSPSFAGLEMNPITGKLDKTNDTNVTEIVSEVWEEQGNNVYLIDTNKNVGIGTTNPAGKLHISGPFVVEGDFSGVLLDYGQKIDGDTSRKFTFSDTIGTYNSNLRLDLDTTSGVASFDSSSTVPIEEVEFVDMTVTATAFVGDGSGLTGIAGGGSVGIGTANTITYWPTTTTIGSLPTGTYPSLTELSYVKGATSNLQAQINGLGSGGWTDNGTVVYNTTTTDNVGIGTTSNIASTKFQVSGNSGTTDDDFIGLFVQNGVTPESSGLSNAGRAVGVQGSGGAYFVGRDVTNDIEFIMGTSTAGASFVGSYTAHDLHFRTNNSTQMILKNSSGNVGIGTTVPVGLLNVSGGYVRIGNGGTNTNATSSGEAYVQGDLEVDGTIYGSLSGNASTVTTNANLTGDVTSSGNTATIADSVTVTGWALGASTATTPAGGDNDTSLATTAYVQTEISGLSGGSSGWTDGTAVIYPTTSTDNVGIGTFAPTQKLQVVGTVQATTFVTNSTSAGALVLNEASANGSNTITISAPSSVTSDRSCALEDDSTPFDNCVSATASGWTDAGATINVTTSTDNVGIGTSSPEKKLVLAGADSDMRIKSTTSSVHGELQFFSDLGESFNIGVGGSTTSPASEAFFENVISGAPTNFISNGGVFGFNGGPVRYVPTDSPPTCNSGLKGGSYYDDSLSELCDCDGTSWAQVDGGGAC